MEIIEMEFKNEKISIPKFIWNPVSDTLKKPVSKDTLNQQIFEYNRSLYADDGAILFESYMDLVNGSKIIDAVLKKFGLLMHKGDKVKKKKPKTEFVYFPSCNDMDEEELNAKQQEFFIEENEYIAHTESFKYLGSFITNYLEDDTDIDARIKSASKMFESLARNILCNKSLGIPTRKRLFIATVTNLLLWGCESWATKETQINKLRVVYDKWIRRMSNVTLKNLKDTHTKMSEIRKLFDDIESLDQIYLKRRLAWFEKISMMKQDDQGTRLPRKFLKTCCITNQCKKRGTGNMSIRESYHNDFKKLNIEQFGTRYIRRKTRATSLEEERIKKLVNAGDLNYLIQLENSPDYHEMVEYCLELKRGSFKSCKKIKRR